MIEHKDYDNGLYYDMPEADYRSASGINKHLLDALASGTPAHLVEHRDNPSDPTPAMQFGTIMHKAVLEPQRLTSIYHVYPDDYDGRTKAGKEWKAEATKHADLPFLHHEEHCNVVGVIQSIYRNSNVVRLIEDSKHEVSWFADMCGVQCKGRVDGLSEQWSTVFDFKFVAEFGCNDDVFQRAVANYRYHVQDAFYTDGLAEVVGGKARAFTFIVCEKVPPFAVRSFVLDAPWIEEGRECYRRELELYKQCAEAKSFPAYPTDFYTLTMPRWVRKGQGTIEGLDIAGIIENE